MLMLAICSDICEVWRTMRDVYHVLCTVGCALYDVMCDVWCDTCSVMLCLVIVWCLAEDTGLAAFVPPLSWKHDMTRAWSHAMWLVHIIHTWRNKISSVMSICQWYIIGACNVDMSLCMSLYTWYLGSLSFCVPVRQCITDVIDALLCLCFFCCFFLSLSLSLSISIIYISISICVCMFLSHAVSTWDGAFGFNSLLQLTHINKFMLITCN